MTPPTEPSLRTVEILPPSVRSETANVLRFAAILVAILWIYLASSAPKGSAAETRDLLPYQTLFRDLPAGEQRTFRELQEGLLEAEAVRSASGRWPAAPALAAQGIPPFAPDPIAKGATCAWTLRQQGTLVNYLGLPARPHAPAWLLAVQEPEPGAPPDRTPPDAEHHRLADGTVLHVSIWSHRDGSKVAPGLFPLPHADGWTQLLAGPPAPAITLAPRR
jgi:hypothetical protein